MCQSWSGRSTRKKPGRRRRPSGLWRCSSRCSRISRWTRLRLTGWPRSREASAATIRVPSVGLLPGDADDRLLRARQRPPVALRRPCRAPVDRLAADPGHAGDQRGRAALRDEFAGPGDALSHSQPLFERRGAVKWQGHEGQLQRFGRSRGGAQFSFGARASHRVRWELSRLLNSQAGRQAARGWPELAGTIERRARRRA